MPTAAASPMRLATSSRADLRRSFELLATVPETKFASMMLRYQWLPDGARLAPAADRPVVAARVAEICVTDAGKG